MLKVNNKIQIFLRHEGHCSCIHVLFYIDHTGEIGE